MLAVDIKPVMARKMSCGCAVVMMVLAAANRQLQLADVKRRLGEEAVGGALTVGGLASFLRDERLGGVEGTFPAEPETLRRAVQNGPVVAMVRVDKVERLHFVLLTAVTSTGVVEIRCPRDGRRRAHFDAVRKSSAGPVIFSSLESRS